MGWKCLDGAVDNSYTIWGRFLPHMLQLKGYPVVPMMAPAYACGGPQRLRHISPMKLIHLLANYNFISIVSEKSLKSQRSSCYGKSLLLMFLTHPIYNMSFSVLSALSARLDEIFS
jgi:hypothetical protein